MKFLGKRIIALLLLCAMALPLASCGTTDPVEPGPAESVSEPPAETTPEPAADLVIGEGKDSAYVIVRSEDATDAEAYSTLLLRSRVNEEYGVSIKPVSDLETANFTQRQEKEIIIGSTTSEGSLYTVDWDAIGKYGYSIQTVGEKIVIAAVSKTGYRAAIEEFVLNLMKKDGETLTVAANASGFADSATIEATLPPLLEVADKETLVGICYSIWFDQIHAGGIYNISEIEAGKANWGPSPAFHYWGKPAQGYYKSSDKNAAKNNMVLLGEAGVDFIIVDMTYMNDSFGEEENIVIATQDLFRPLETIFDAIHEVRDEGGAAPCVVLWYGSSHEAILLDALIERYFSKDEYKDCWVYWDGKPFILTWNGEPDFAYPDQFTVRTMLGMTNGKESWNYIAPSNRATVYKRDGVAEQISVSAACQQGYMSDTHLAYGRDSGRFFNQQWQSAFRIRPKFVTITWWNEWCAQRIQVGDTYKFTDNYNQEYSRDIEPMAGGHGDQYYQWMKQYIAAYKAGEKCPILIEEK